MGRFADVSNAYVLNSFDARNEETKGRRLAARDALIKIGDQYSSQGISLSVEDWARESQSLLGNDGWLNNSAPSVEALGVMQKQQAEKAKQTAEERRRSQVQADSNERKSMEADAMEYFVNGDDPVTVYSSMVDKYGERANALKPNLKRLEVMARTKTMNEGIQFGSMALNDVSEFESYKRDNPGLPKFYLDGVEKAAREKTNQRNAKIADMANQRGASMGFANNETDREWFRQQVKTMYPDLPDDVTDRTINGAMKTASGAFQSASLATEAKTATSMQISANQTYPADMANLAVAKERDSAKRMMLSNERQKSYDGVITTQADFATKIADPKGPFKDLDQQKKSQLFMDFKTHVFQDAEGYAEAVRTGDKEKMARLRGAAQPVELYRANAEKVSRFITGADGYTSLGEAMQNLTSLGASSSDLMKLGQEIARNDGVAASNTGSKGVRSTFRSGVGVFASDSGVTYDAMGNPSGSYGSVSESAAMNGNDSDISASAKLSSSMLRRGFVDNTAQYIKDIREAVQQNGRFNASPEELGEIEFKLILSRAEAVARGMGTRPDQISNVAAQLYAEVAKVTGTPNKIIKRDSPVEELESALRRRLDGNYQPNGYQTGGPRPATNQRAGWKDQAGF